MASPVATKRLTKEFVTIQRNPPPFISAHPLESNILEWHYVIEGPPESPYEGGIYHGVLLFPSEYPFKPPAIKMFTPNGRFQTNFRLCLTMSDYHPSTWNPAWSVSTILTGLLSFMLEDTPTTGSITTTLAEKRKFARQSVKWNLEDPVFVRLFPKYLVISAELLSSLDNKLTVQSENKSQSDQQETKDSKHGHTNIKKSESTQSLVLKFIIYFGIAMIFILIAFVFIGSQLVIEQHQEYHTENEL